jgi:HTH-type transcriptional regulator / antitoxin HigA
MAAAKIRLKSVRDAADPPKGLRVGARYHQLFDAFPLRPLRTDAERDRAQEMLEWLLRAKKDRRSPDEQDYFDILVRLIEEYENVHYPMGEPTDVEMVEHLMAIRGLSQTELAIGVRIHKATLSNLMTGRRRLTREHIEAIAAFFHVSPAVFYPSTVKRTHAAGADALEADTTTRPSGAPAARKAKRVKPIP